MEYHHKQIGVTVIVLVICVILLLLITPLLNFGNIHQIPPIGLASILIILVLTLVLFYSLTVEIKEKILVCYFGIGLIRKKIPLADIQQVQMVQNPMYAGWGIRWMPGKYWLLNVSGLRAVELTLKNGKRFRIGTDEPEKLVDAIKVNKEMAA